MNSDGDAAAAAVEAVEATTDPNREYYVEAVSSASNRRAREAHHAANSTTLSESKITRALALREHFHNCGGRPTPTTSAGRIKGEIAGDR